MDELLLSKVDTLLARNYYTTLTINYMIHTLIRSTVKLLRFNM
jgi:hypothetical protein